MRPSMLAVPLILALLPSTLAQHTSGGGGGGSGGSSGGYSGGGFSGSSGGSHGGGYSGGGGSGGYSGGHSSGGTSSNGHAGVSSHVASGSSTHSPTGKEGSRSVVESNGEQRAFYYATNTGNPSAVHDHLLDETLAKIHLALPSNLATDQYVPAHLPKHQDPNKPDEILLGNNKKPKASSEDKAALLRPCRGKNCAPRLPVVQCSGQFVNGRCSLTNRVWNISNDAYTDIEENCGYLNRRLAKEQSKTAQLRDREQTACSPSLHGPDCASTTTKIAKQDSKIAQLRTQYERCVVKELHNKMLISISKP